MDSLEKSYKKYPGDKVDYFLSTKNYKELNYSVFNKALKSLIVSAKVKG